MKKKSFTNHYYFYSLINSRKESIVPYRKFIKRECLTVIHFTFLKFSLGFLNTKLFYNSSNPKLAPSSIYETELEK